MTDWQPPEGYKLVYQGLNYNVYCNGSLHMKTQGGHAGHEVAPYPRNSNHACNCEYWRVFKETYMD